MRFRRLITPLMGALALGGCAVSTPFHAFDPAALRQAGDTRAVISLTLAVLNDDDAAQDVFWRYVEHVETTLPSQPGIIGFSKRTELFGNQAWTMTVWRDEKSLIAFLGAPAHRAAVRDAMGALADAKFVRRSINIADVPMDWAIAVRDVAQNGRAYYE